MTITAPERRSAEADEVVPHALFKQLTWALDDDLAVQAEAGLVLKLEVVLRFVDVATYQDGRRSWVTQVLEIGQLHE